MLSGGGAQRTTKWITLERLNNKAPPESQLTAGSKHTYPTCAAASGLDRRLQES